MSETPISGPEPGTEPDPEPDPSEDDSSTRTIYLLAALVTAVAVWGTITTSIAADPVLDLPVPMFAIALAFALTERFPIHIELRREAHSFSLSTIPLVIGLFALEPLWLVVARLIGSGLVLLYNRQSFMKLVMNMSSFWLEVVVAVMVFRFLLPDDPLSGGAWIAALAAGVASDLVQMVIISSAIAIYVNRFDVREAIPTVIATMGAVVDTCVALVAVVLMVEAPAALPLLAVIPGVLWVSYSAYSNLHDKHRSLEEVYGFTRGLSAASGRGTVVETLLGHVQDLLHADQSWLFLESGQGGRRWALDAGGTAQVTHLDLDSPERQLHRIAELRGPALVNAAEAGVDQMASLVRDLGHRQALVAHMSGATGTLATLVVADRSGDVREFHEDDRRLFEALAHQAGVALDNAELIHRLRTEAATNEYQSLHDALTDLPNRLHFDRALNEALEAQTPVAVLLLDLDRFKEVNDTLGHHNGDLLLQEVGVRLRAVLRRDDTVARLGGDEFAVLVSDLVAADAAEHVAHAVRAVLERPIHLGEVEVAVGASIGIAVSPDHGTTAELLMQRADVAMYLAKEAGTGVALYDPQRDEYSPARLALVGELRSALAGRELDVHYQPIFDLESGEVTGVEALARWTHPKRGLIPPDEFIKIAENTGLINDLTDQVLAAATAQTAAWRAQGHRLRVSVNLSARNLLDPWLIDLVRNRLAEVGLPGSALCLEITESCAMADPTRTWALLSRLGQLGVDVAIDDFGTGYSSLAYLKRLPVHEVKIDRSFVSALGGRNTSPADYAIVRAVAELADSLGLRVVAEGIEDEQTRAVALDAGCRGGQGFLWSRPLPAAELTAWLEGRRDGARTTNPADEEAEAVEAEEAEEPPGVIRMPFRRSS